jgi:hypothetical protein
VRHWREETDLQGGQIQHMQQLIWPQLYNTLGMTLITRLDKPDPLDSSSTINVYQTKINTYRDYHKSTPTGLGNLTAGDYVSTPIPNWTYPVKTLIWAAEGPNEWDGTRATGAGLVGPPSTPISVSPITGMSYGAAYPYWAEQYTLYTRQIYQSYKNDVATAGLNIVAGSQGSTNSANSILAVANKVLNVANGVTSICTHNNYHVYCGQGKQFSQPSTPSMRVSVASNACKITSATKPYVCTETGMHDAMSSTTSFSPHPRDVQGSYAPRVILENLYVGTKVVSIFDLVDDPLLTVPNDAGHNYPLGNAQETSFGLYTRDWVMKPSAQALANLSTIFADPGAAFTPPPLGIGFATTPTNFKSLLFQKRTGVYMLALWRDMSLFDYATPGDYPSGSRVTVTPSNVVINLDDVYTLRTFAPTTSTTPTVLGNLNHVTISLAADVVVLEIT